MASDMVPIVVVIGSSHVDLVARASRLPVKGETLPGVAFEMHAGGKGGNQAAACARSGARTRFLGRLGRDAFADRLIAALESAGVDLSWLSRDDSAGTGCSTVLTGEDGDYASIIVPGSSMLLTANHVRDMADAFSACGAVIGQLEINPATTAAALEAGRRAGAVTILNAAPAPASPDSLPATLLQATDVLVVNRVEGAMLLGQDPETDESDPQRTVDALQRRWECETVIMTLGERGLVARVGERTITLPAHPVIPVDTIGAGDAFTGTLAASLASEMAIDEAIQRANAAGAIAVTRAGGHDAAPTALEVDAFLANAG